MASEEARAIVKACRGDREGPWDPVQDCIAPLIGLLSAERFTPAYWEKVGGVPDLHMEYLNQYYRLVDTEMCYLWLQNNLNPQTASEFQTKLERCAERWGKWSLAALRRGSGKEGWCRWAEDNADLKGEWDDIMEDIDATRDYLRKLAIIINAKIKAQHKKETGTSEGGRMEEASPPTGRWGRWLWRLYEKTIKAFFGALLEHFGRN